MAESKIDRLAHQLVEALLEAGQEVYVNEFTVTRRDLPTAEIVTVAVSTHNRAAKSAGLPARLGSEMQVSRCPTCNRPW